MIHRMHLRQIERVEEVIGQIEAGHAEPARAVEGMADLKMIVNYRLFGNLCGQECRHLTFHHTSEDQHLFPALMRGSEGLRRVIERLIEEHVVIHALLERLEAQAITLLESPGQESFAPLKETFVQLAGTVRSHFSYEQTEMEEAIGFYGIQI